MAYVNSFENISHVIEEPILELRDLGQFIASIVRDGDEIAPYDNPPKKPTLSKSSLSMPSSSSHLAKILNPVEEASGSRRPVETESASTLPTPSPYLNTILNRELATQASTSGHVQTESTASQRGGGSSALEDLLEAAGYGSKKSPSPEHEPERESKIGAQHQGSPSYSPPPSPAVSVDQSSKPFSVSSIKAEEPSPDISESILLQPSTLYDSKPSLAPPGTPQWKIDLSERKGHRIDILHVSPRELEILARCLTLVHKATLKGEECMRVIIARKDLATEMEREYKQWDELCDELEDNVSIDEKEAREKMKEEFEYAKADKGKGKGKEAKDRHDYGGDTHGGRSDDWFGPGGGHGDPRDYGRVGSRDGKNAWGYGKVDARPKGEAADSVRRRITTYDDDGDETIDEEEEGLGSPMSESHRSPGTEGVDVVTHFEEAYEEDQEMLDVGAGLGPGEMAEEPLAQDEEKGANVGEMSGTVAAADDVAEEEDTEMWDDEKKGRKSGAKAPGLYGEDL